MCGIFCSIIHNQNTFLNDVSKKGSLRETSVEFSDSYLGFAGRGPDASHELYVDVSDFTILQLAGCVLWTQGTKPVTQPLVDSDGNILLWNGDIFGGPHASDANDTEALSMRLQSATQENECILSVFSQILGPFSFIYYQREKKKLSFGRDVIGRHSLILNKGQRSITISSVSSRKQTNSVEVPAVGIFYIDLSQVALLLYDEVKTVQHIPSIQSGPDVIKQGVVLAKDGDMPLFLHPWSHLTASLIDLKLTDFPDREALIMLDPIESSIKITDFNQKEPTEAELAMWTVFRHDVSMSQLMDKLNNGDSKTRIRRTMVTLLEKQDVLILVEDLIKTLTASIRVRLEKLPPYCKTCIKEGISGEDGANFPCNHSKIAILFSGGLDSAVLAALANGHVAESEPIDLLNVAFERCKSDPEKPSMRRMSPMGVYSVVQEVTYKVPDRGTGLQTLMELRTLFPNRKWNFIEVNVTQEELKQAREEYIADLIHPLTTILDDSLGCALWFASRGKGILSGPTREQYTSPARIILSGIGADEQLGGYMRHRTTLQHKGGWSPLAAELALELGRIGERNLGRDDRITSSHGRQCRMPYLDEHVVSFLSFLPPWQRCNPVESMPPGLGDKILLRLAAWHLGLRAAANLPKRAMQFGSRIANSKEKGNDICNRL